MTSLRVVEKHRRCASPREGNKQSWWEYQVKDGRRVLSRHDVREHAEAELVKIRAERALATPAVA